MAIYFTIKIYWQRPTAPSSVLYCIPNYSPPAAGNLYIQGLTWSYVRLFILAGVRGYFQIEVTRGVQSVTVYSLRYCVVCIYLCPIKTLSLLRVFKITLQIYLVQGMEAIIANKPSCSGILMSLLGVNSKIKYNNRKLSSG